MMALVAANGATVSRLFFELTLIVLVARVGGAFARRVGQPAVIGEILGGIALGPTVLGRLLPAGMPSPFTSLSSLGVIADVGLVFFMFLVGLELDGELIRREGRRAFAVSLGGILLPLAGGMLVAGALAPYNVVDGVPVAPDVLRLFVGVAMCITAFPVLARTLVERGLYKSRLGTTVLCAAALDDAIAWALLAALAGYARTGSARAVLPSLLLGFTFVVLVFTLGRMLAGRVLLRGSRHGVTIDGVAFAVGGALLCAAVTEAMGLHAIFGAFVWGTAIPRERHVARDLADRLEDVTGAILLPVFFALAGLRLDLFALRSPSLAGWTLVVTAVAIGGKVLGCFLGARSSGFASRDAMLVGSLMNTRGLTELVVLGVGRDLGIIGPEIFAMMVVMTIVTTTMTGPLVGRLVSRLSLIHLLTTRGDRARARVVIGIGNQRDGEVLVDVAASLAGEPADTELLLTRLVPTPRAPEFRSGVRDEEADTRRAVRTLAPLVEQARARGFTAQTLSFLSDDVGRDLADVAQVTGAEFVLIGWNRDNMLRGRRSMLVRRLMVRAQCPVVELVDREGAGIRPPEQGRPAAPVRIVSAGTAPDEPDATALRFGERLAQRLATTLTVTDAEAPADASPVSAVLVSLGDDRGQRAGVIAARANAPVLLLAPPRRAPA